MPKKLLSPGQLIADLCLPPVGQIPLGEIEGLAKLTALRRSAAGTFYFSNIYRGELLYQLVRGLKPANVLEIGTGRGYGALCMAMAARDAGLATRIYSIDLVPPDRKQTWALDSGSGPEVKSLSLQEVWNEIDRGLTSRITLLTGPSPRCMKRLLQSPEFPGIDFAFIDGGHDYWVVRHDITATLLSARNRRTSVLLDDYDGIQGKAIKKLTDTALAKSFPSQIMHFIAMPSSEAELAENGFHGMVFLDGRTGGVTADALSEVWSCNLGLLRLAVAIESASLRARIAARSLIHRIFRFPDSARTGPKKHRLAGNS